MKKKYFKRILTVMLTLMIIISSVLPAFAADTLHSPQIKDGTAKWERIKFGTNDSNPITWRVLKVDKSAGKALVLMDGLVQNTKGGAMSKRTSFVWADSIIRSFLNINKWDSWFTAEQKESIVSTTIDNDDGSRLFILTKDELSSSSYGFLDNRCRLIDNKTNHPKQYFTRTPASTDTMIATVNSNGAFSSIATDTDNYYIRPAMWVKLDAGYTYAGTIDSTGTVNETEHLSEGLPNTDSSDARGAYLWIMLMCLGGAAVMYGVKIKRD